MINNNLKKIQKPEKGDKKTKFSQAHLDNESKKSFKPWNKLLILLIIINTFQISCSDSAPSEDTAKKVSEKISKSTQNSQSSSGKNKPKRKKQISLTPKQKKKIKTQKSKISPHLWKLKKAVRRISQTQKTSEAPLQKNSSELPEVIADFSIDNTLLVNDQWLIPYQVQANQNNHDHTEFSLDLTQVKSSLLRRLFGHFIRAQITISENFLTLKETPVAVFNEKEKLQLEWREYTFQKWSPPETQDTSNPVLEENINSEIKEDSDNDSSANRKSAERNLSEKNSTEDDFTDSSFLNELSDEDLLLFSD